MRSSMLAIVAVAGCASVHHGPVTANATCANCATEVATYSKLDVVTSWQGSCVRDRDDGAGFGLGAHWGGGESSRTSYLCDRVDYQVVATCPEGACEVHGGTVIPTQPGRT